MKTVRLLMQDCRAMLVVVVLRWMILAVAIGFAAWMVLDLTVDGGILSLLLVAAALGMVDALSGPVVRLLETPARFASFGLLTLVVNGTLLATAARLIGTLEVRSFLESVAAIVGVSIVSFFVLGVTARDVVWREIRSPQEPARS